MKTQSRTPVEPALTCSPNSQLMFLFLVKNALELTAFLARDHGSNNTIMPGSSSSRRCQSSEEGGLRRVGCQSDAPLVGFVYSEEEERHIRRHGRTRCSGGDAQPPLPCTRLCHRRDLAQGPNERLRPFFPTLSFQIYSALWRQIQTQRQRITHFKPQGALYKAGVTDKNHLWCLFGCVNSLL